jgi:LPS O-antigen subunit length determinant protein (WzzB/FepE family)
MGNINAAFFGDEPEQPPVFSGTRRYHLRRSELDTWSASNAGYFALATLFVSREAAAQLSGTASLAELERKETVMLASLAVVSNGLSSFLDVWDALRPVAHAFDLDEASFVASLESLLVHRLTEVQSVLREWIANASFDPEETGNDHASPADHSEVWRQRMRYRANVDYREALFHLLEPSDVDAKMGLCQEIGFWYRLSQDPKQAEEWDARLVKLVRRHGDPAETAKALLRQSLYLLHDKKYTETISRARQALSIAESLGDESLARQCRRRIDSAKYFMRDATQQ